MTELTPAQRAEVLERHLHEHGHLHPDDIDAANVFGPDATHTLLVDIWERDLEEAT